MRILILGNGAREDALRNCFERFGHTVYVAPGNAGILKEQCIYINPTDPVQVIRHAQKLGVGLVVIGPEMPLALGVVDALEDAGIPAFGPTKEAARLEASKAYMKRICFEAGIPTAKSFVAGTYQEAKRIIGAFTKDIVVKADGLCAGKGVEVTKSKAEAMRAAHEMLVLHTFNTAGSVVLFEERLTGTECSVLAICDGKNAYVLPCARDYKKLRENDLGKNTGGMGAYSPPPDVSDTLVSQIVEKFIHPALSKLRKKYDSPFRGVLYAGLMLTDSGPKLLEFNVRFGDPEAQVILPRLTSDLVPYLMATRKGDLSNLKPFSVDKRVSVGVVAAMSGYPGTPEKSPSLITDKYDGSLRDVSHTYYAGVKGDPHAGLYATKGRVLTTVGLGNTIAEARKIAYDRLSFIQFDGKYFRGDIARGL